MVKEELIVDFVNSRDLMPEREDLGTPTQLVGWLRERGLEPGGRASAAELEEALAVREALRELLLAHNDCECDPLGAARTLDAAARRAGLELRFRDGGATLEPRAKGVRGAVGRILVAVSESMAEGTWSRLKACRAENCKWAFYDSAKNHSRAWCSMRSCGNRAKVQAFRERHRA
jgi:predicted RNA-binding Zn ribbon-like protein